MKTARVAFLVIILVVTVVTISVAFRGINETSEAVRDYSGQPVKPKIPYFIQVSGQPEVWVSRDKRYIDNMCPQVAILSSSPMAVIFLQKSKANYVPLDSNISISWYDSFEKFDLCLESGIWRVDKQSPFPRYDIPSSGSAFDPDSTFKIQNSNDVYKFVYDSDNIGVYPDQETLIEHLVLNPTPLDVIFIQAPYAEDRTSS